MAQLAWNVVRGFLMGMADVVPGVSGGTIALVVGIYERLVASVRAASKALVAVLRGRRTEAGEWWRRIEWPLILPLLAGILLAIALLSRVIEHQLEVNPVQLAGLFIGLVAGSVIVAWGLMRRHRPVDYVSMAVVAVATFIVLGLRSGTTEETVGQVAEPTMLAFFAAGAVAICAMILPGISGSFLLVVVGMYGPVLAAVSGFDLGVLLVFGCGAVVGLAVFSQALHWALARYHDEVIAAIIGLMVGSTRVLWPWPLGVSSTRLEPPGDHVVAVLALAVVGLVVVLALNRLSRRLDPAAQTRIPEVREPSGRRGEEIPR